MNDEFAPLAYTLTARADTTTVHLQQPMNQRQTDAEPSLPTFVLGMDLCKEIKNSWQLLSGNTHARVTDADGDFATFLAHGKRDVSTWLRVFGGIA